MSDKQACVLLGVTGCIAAYKSCEIIRGLQKAGVRVKVVMTEHATEFVGPTTFRALTREPVAVGLFDSPSDPIHHISLAQECDLFLIAPCTANVAAKIAHGIADDLLTTTALATSAPIVLAPAMNVGMYEAAATQENFEILRRRGVRFIDSGTGYQACGDVGKGRLEEPEIIVARVLEMLKELPVTFQAEMAHDLEGKRIMITAGPTVEPIDAVRYISNYSSGKMGYALAKAALLRGAHVTLVSGQVSIAAPEDVELVRVGTAREMLAAAEVAFETADISIFAAAVADFRPETSFDHKLKKGVDDQGLRTIMLVENPDILKTLGHVKNGSQVVVGFAAETDNVLENAKTKLANKNADMIVANQVGNGLAFGTDDNRASLVLEDDVIDLPNMSKDDLAHRILDAAVKLLEQKAV